MLATFVVTIDVISVLSGLSLAMSHESADLQNEIDQPPNITKACEVLPELQIFGANYNIPGNSQETNVYYRNENVNKSHVYYVKNYTIGNHAMSTLFVGTFFVTETYTGNYVVPNGVSIRKQGGDSDREYRYVMHYSDMTTCVILGVYEPGQVSGNRCRLLVIPEVMQDQRVTPCEQKFHQFCGKLFSKRFLHSRTQENNAVSWNK
uniref:Putative secreted protein n=1 Tax=Amblyomma americanum TaxID=6943 RepID=A0A0C9SE90_AMBAM